MLAAWICIRPNSLDFDEVWMTQVLRRVLEGETLYRDIFFGVPPLSVYATAAIGKLFGAELIVVRCVPPQRRSAWGCGGAWTAPRSWGWAVPKRLSWRWACWRLEFQ